MAIHVAALVAAAVLRKNPDAIVLPFENDVVERLRLNPRDSILTNAEKLAAVGGGGTNCSAPLAWLNRKGVKADLIWYVSDNQSWVDHPESYYGGTQATGTMAEFSSLKKRHAQAKLVLLDIQPYSTTVAHDRSDILNIGGFSDHVFDIVAGFAKLSDSFFIVDEIRKVSLD